MFPRGLAPTDMPVGGTATAGAPERARDPAHRAPRTRDHVPPRLLAPEGENLEGEAGTGTSGGSGTAALTPSLTGVRALAVGYYHTCAVLSNGTAECWGRNTQGQLGNGTTTTQLLPAAVSGLGAVSNGGRVVTGLMYSCGLLPDGRVKCWGRNDNNQRGNNTLIEEPAAVYAEIVGAGDLFAGQFKTCAILANGTWCF